MNQIQRTMSRIANDLRATVPAPAPDNRPTVPAPAYAACRAAALRAQLAHELLIEETCARETWPAPASDWEVES